MEQQSGMYMDSHTPEIIEPLRRLTRDEASAAASLSVDEARFLVSTYYRMQDDRIRAAGQVRSLVRDEKPADALLWLEGQSQMLEQQIKRALNIYSAAHPLGQWARSIKGIGPVIAAGLLAHIRIGDNESVGSLWAFAGLDPTREWKAKTKRPWNAELKTLCWKAGESFVKVNGRDGDVYGKIYAERKAYEQAKNEAGDYAEQAKAKLEKYNIGKTTDAYKFYSEGKLPPGHIHARAKRYAVKMFLSHYFEVAYFLERGKRAPLPYAINILKHVDYLPPPNTDSIPGWQEL